MSRLCLAAVAGSCIALLGCESSSPSAGEPAKPGANLASDSSKATDAQLPPGVPSAESKDAAPAPKQPVDKDVVLISQLPSDTQCRKVTTELEIRKKKGDADAEKNSNTAIFCQTAPGEWKPAAA